MSDGIERIMEKATATITAAMATPDDVATLATDDSLVPFEDTSEGKPVDCFAYCGKPGWHGKGQKVSEVRDRTVDVEVIERAARANWSVHRDSLIAEKSGRKLKGHYGLVRDPDDKLLGLCSDKFQIHQHKRLGRIGDKLRLADKGFWESVGVLNDGQRVFYCLRLDQTIKGSNANDPIELYAVITTQYDGTRATDALVTAVRVECQNTLAMAIDEGTKIVHLGATDEKLQALEDRLLGIDMTITKLQDGITATTGLVFNDKQAQALLDLIVPVPDLPHAEVFERMGEDKQKRLLYEQDFAMRIQAKIRECHDNWVGAETAVRGTGYAWLNAFTAYATHIMKSNSKIESNMVGDASKMGRRVYEVLTTQRLRDKVLNG